MTLDDHFALKSVSDSASNGLAFWLSGKIVPTFADLSTLLYRPTVNGKNVAHGLGVYR